MMDFAAILDGFASLDPGWNGYNALPPSADAIKTGKRVCRAFEFEKLIPHRLAPSAMGGVGITLRDESRRVYVEIDNGGLIAAVALSRLPGNDEIEATSFLGGTSSILRAIIWVKRALGLE